MTNTPQSLREELYLLHRYTPVDVSDPNIENIAKALTDATLSFVTATIEAARLPGRQLIEPVTKRPVAKGDKAGIDLDADTKGSLVFVQDNGYNKGAEAQFEAIKAVLEGK